MLDSVVRFSENAAGLEKTLRLLQALAQICAGLAASADDAAPWLRVRSNFAVGRRYFRLLKWQPCWSMAYRQSVADQSSLRMVLDVAKWSFLGMYFFLEMFTITNVIQLTSFKWGPTVQTEANKFWFYALVVSIVLSLYDLLAATISRPPKDPSKEATSRNDPVTPDEKSKEVTPAPSEKANPVKPSTTRSVDVAKTYRQLVVDLCDLSIPGSALGWMSLDPVTVGVASSISSLISGRDIWLRTQS